MKAVTLSRVGNSFLNDGKHDFESLVAQMPCDVKQYSVYDIVVFPDGQLVNKDFLVIDGEFISRQNCPCLKHRDICTCESPF